MSEQTIYIAAALIFGIMIGRGQDKQTGTGSAVEQTAVKPADWWTFAGSWA